MVPLDRKSAEAAAEGHQVEEIATEAPSEVALEEPASLDDYDYGRLGQLQYPNKYATNEKLETMEMKSVAGSYWLTNTISFESTVNLFLISEACLIALVVIGGVGYLAWKNVTKR